MLQLTHDVDNVQNPCKTVIGLMLGQVGIDLTKTMYETIDYISTSFEALVVQGKWKDDTIDLCSLWKYQVNILYSNSVLRVSVTIFWREIIRLSFVSHIEVKLNNI